MERFTLSIKTVIYYGFVISVFLMELMPGRALLVSQLVMAGVVLRKFLQATMASFMRLLQMANYIGINTSGMRPGWPLGAALAAVN